MTIRIEPGPDGRDVIRTDLADCSRGRNAKVRAQALHADNVLIRASDGHVFTAPADFRGMGRLSPAEVEMVQHYIAERGVPKPVVFAGESTPPAAVDDEPTDAADDPAV